MKLRKRITAMALGILGCAGVLTTAAFAETGTPTESSAVEAKVDEAGESQADTADESKPEAATEESSAAEESSSGTEAETSGQTQGEETDEKSGPTVHQLDAKLTVNAFEDLDTKKTPVEKDGKGVHISLYKIASINADGEYTLEGEIAKALVGAGISSVTIDDIANTDKNAEIRKAVGDYLEKEESKVSASYDGETENGTIKFDIPAEELGLYYLEGDIIEEYFEGDVDGKTGKLSYIPSTSLVSLPLYVQSEKSSDYWDYIPTVNVKYTQGGAWIDPPVLKIVKETADPVGQGRDFTFVLESVKGAPLPNAEENRLETAANGTVVKMTYPAAKQQIIDKNDKETQKGESQEFGEIWFSQPGLYKYVVREMEETVTGYTFDKTEYRLYAEVELQDDRTLGGKQWYEKVVNGEVTETSEEYDLGPGRDTPFVFTNTYTHEDDTPGDKTYFDPSVKKIVKVTDKAIEGELTFKFILEAKEGTPMPGGSTVAGGTLKKEATVKITQTTAAAGVTTDFGGITFDKAGTWKYKIYEDTKVIAPHTTFDTTVYDIEVYSDGTNVHGMVTNSKTGETSDWDGKDIEFLFTNTYTRKGGGGGGGGGRRGGGSTPTPTTTMVPETEPEVIPGMLPKTGMLWWPVPVLAVAGIFLLAAGFILERRRS